MEKLLDNPIDDIIKNSLLKCKNRLLIAVPFTSSFAEEFLAEENVKSVKDKRIITRLDERNLTSFNVPFLIRMIEKYGFKIRVNKDIHLKLYIFDYDSYVGSNNLTESGFKHNLELMVRLDKSNNQKAKEIFEKIWEDSDPQEIEVLKKLLRKYNELKKNTPEDNEEIPIITKTIGKYSKKDIINFIVKETKFNSDELINKANSERKKYLDKLKKHGFEKSIFYSEEENKSNIFYSFLYGIENQLAGMGSFQYQLLESLNDPTFINAIEYIYPPIKNKKLHKLENKNIRKDFCNKIFDFKIRQYREEIPIRIVSFFYPDYFIPIFNLNDLEYVCRSLGYTSKFKSRGDKLYFYNNFLIKQFKNIKTVQNNYNIAQISYDLYFFFYTYKKIIDGYNVEEIKAEFNKEWKKDHVVKALWQIQKFESSSKKSL